MTSPGGPPRGWRWRWPGMWLWLWLLLLHVCSSRANPSLVSVYPSNGAVVPGFPHYIVLNFSEPVVTNYASSLQQRLIYVAYGSLQVVPQSSDCLRGEGTSSFAIDTTNAVFTFTQTAYGPYYIVVQAGSVASVANGQLITTTTTQSFYLNCTAMGLTQCGNICTSLQTDDNNCGACGNVCVNGAACLTSACTCSPNYINCSGTCYNALFDNNHCGSCSRVCATDAGCFYGGCLCSTDGLTDCNTGHCVNTTNDVQNCGTCSNACKANETCCTGTCANLQTDANHCSACGHKCAAGMDCHAGICVTHTPTPTATATATITSTGTPIPTLTPTPTATATATLTRSATLTHTSTPTGTRTTSLTPTSTSSRTRSITPTGSDTTTDTATGTRTRSITRTVTETRTASLTRTSSITSTTTATATSSGTETSTATPVPTTTPTLTSSGTATSTPVPTATHTPTATFGIGLVLIRATPPDGAQVAHFPAAIDLLFSRRAAVAAAYAATPLRVDAGGTQAVVPEAALQWTGLYTLTINTSYFAQDVYVGPSLVGPFTVVIPSGAVVVPGTLETTAAQSTFQLNCSLANETQCGDVCADLLTSSSHCGTCNNSCVATRLCSNATCVCRPGLLPCKYTTECLVKCPTDTPTPTHTTTATSTSTNTRTRTITSSRTTTATLTTTLTVIPTRTSTPTDTVIPTRTPTLTSTVIPTKTTTPSLTASATPTVVPTLTHTMTLTRTMGPWDFGNASDYRLPQAAIAGVILLGDCRRVELDGTGSVAGTPVAFQWQALAGAEAALQLAVRQQASQPRIQLSWDLFTSPITVFALTITDRYLRTDNATYAVGGRPPELPALWPSPVNVTASPTLPLSLSTARYARLCGAAPDAVGTYNLPAHWQLLSRPAGLPGVPADFFTATPEFVVPAYTLTPGEVYDVQATMAAATGRGLPARVQFRIQVIFQPLVARLRTGSQQVSYGQTLALDGSPSFDPLVLPTQPSLLSWAWTACPTSGSVSSALSSGAPAFPDAAPCTAGVPLPTLFENATATANTSALTVAIPALLATRRTTPVSPGQYLFTLAIAKDMRNASTALLVTVVASDSAQVALAWQPHFVRQSKLNNDEALQMFCIVQLPAGTSVQQVQWALWDNGTAVPLQNATFSFSAAGATLIMGPPASLWDGPLVAQVTVSTQDLSAVAAQYVVPVNAVPTGGTLWARSLTTGAALTAAGGGTSIALDAPGWVDPDGSPGQPLAYAYSYLDPTLGVWTPLLLQSSSSGDTTVIVTVPFAATQTPLAMRVVVQDVDGGANASVARLNVTAQLAPGGSLATAVARLHTAADLPSLDLTLAAAQALLSLLPALSPADAAAAASGRAAQQALRSLQAVPTPTVTPQQQAAMLAVLRAVAAGSLPDLTDADLAAVPPLVARAVPGYPAPLPADLAAAALNVTGAALQQWAGRRGVPAAGDLLALDLDALAPAPDTAPAQAAVASVLAALATQQAMPLLPGQQWCGADGGLAVCVCQFLATSANLSCALRVGGQLYAQADVAPGWQARVATPLGVTVQLLLSYVACSPLTWPANQSTPVFTALLRSEGANVSFQEVDAAVDPVRPLRLTAYYPTVTPARPLACWWWNATAGRWSGGGVTAGGRTPRSVACLSPRLGTFAATYHDGGWRPADDSGVCRWVCWGSLIAWAAALGLFLLAALLSRCWWLPRSPTASGSCVVPDALALPALCRLYHLWVAWLSLPGWLDSLVAALLLLLLVLFAFGLQAVWPPLDWPAAGWHGVVDGAIVFAALLPLWFLSLLGPLPPPPPRAVLYVTGGSKKPKCPPAVGNWPNPLEPPPGVNAMLSTEPASDTEPLPLPMMLPLDLLDAAAKRPPAPAEGGGDAAEAAQLLLDYALGDLFGNNVIIGVHLISVAFDCNVEAAIGRAAAMMNVSYWEMHTLLGQCELDSTEWLLAINEMRGGQRGPASVMFRDALLDMNSHPQLEVTPDSVTPWLDYYDRNLVGDEELLATTGAALSPEEWDAARRPIIAPWPQPYDLLNATRSTLPVPASARLSNATPSLAALRSPSVFPMDLWELVADAAPDPRRTPSGMALPGMVPGEDEDGTPTALPEAARVRLTEAGRRRWLEAVRTVQRGQYYRGARMFVEAVDSQTVGNEEEFGLQWALHYSGLRTAEAQAQFRQHWYEQRVAFHSPAVRAALQSPPALRGSDVLPQFSVTGASTLSSLRGASSSQFTTRTGRVVLHPIPSAHSEREPSGDPPPVAAPSSTGPKPSPPPPAPAPLPPPSATDVDSPTAAPAVSASTPFPVSRNNSVEPTVSFPSLRPHASSMRAQRDSEPPLSQSAALPDSPVLSDVAQDPSAAPALDFTAAEVHLSASAAMGLRQGDGDRPEGLWVRSPNASFAKSASDAPSGTFEQPFPGIVAALQVAKVGDRLRLLGDLPYPPLVLHNPPHGLRLEAAPGHRIVIRPTEVHGAAVLVTNAQHLTIAGLEIEGPAGIRLIDCHDVALLDCAFHGHAPHLTTVRCTATAAPLAYLRVSSRAVAYRLDAWKRRQWAWWTPTLALGLAVLAAVITILICFSRPGCLSPYDGVAILVCVAVHALVLEPCKVALFGWLLWRGPAPLPAAPP